MVVTRQDVFNGRSRSRDHRQQAQRMMLEAPPIVQTLPWQTRHEVSGCPRTLRIAPRH